MVIILLENLLLLWLVHSIALSGEKLFVITFDAEPGCRERLVLGSRLSIRSLPLTLLYRTIID